MDRIAEMALTIEDRLDHIDILGFDDDFEKPDAVCLITVREALAAETARDDAAEAVDEILAVIRERQVAEALCHYANPTRGTKP